MQSKSVWELATLAHNIDIHEISGPAVEALDKYLIDSFSVGAAGMRTPEMNSFLAAWPHTSGHCSLFGTRETASLEEAIMLNGTALCVLELDEGNKFARGHPGAHVLPAALAEGQRIDASGGDLLSAVLAGYEVATKVAREFAPAAGLHPHGHWGAIGAAVAIGKLNSFSLEHLAQAIDAAAGLPLATPFSAATKGSFVRNSWIPSAGINGVTAARIVQAGLGSVDGTGESTYGDLLGSINEQDSAGTTSWEITGSYFKRHPSCNYTHPPADAVLELVDSHSLVPNEVASIQVGTHSLAASLIESQPQTRLAAMFSIPHVVAVALAKGECRPTDFSPENLNDPEIARLRNLVTVELNANIDRKRPAERGAIVAVTTALGEVYTASVPNSIGDADYHPFSYEQIVDKATHLIGAVDTHHIVDEVNSLKTLSSLRSFATSTEHSHIQET